MSQLQVLIKNPRHETLIKWLYSRELRYGGWVDIQHLNLWDMQQFILWKEIDYITLLSVLHEERPSKYFALKVKLSKQAKLDLEELS